ncbi:putative GRF1-interacting factor 1 [Iris pallida]|nr:putative GRF1-interacting factor 1 [Iris pallida]
MYLAAIADNQPQVPTIAQFPPNTAMSARYMQHQQAQQMTPQSLMAARSSMPYAQSPMSALQQQQAAMLGQLGMGTGGSSSGFTILHGETNVGGNGTMSASGVFSDYGRGGAGKQEMTTEVRGGSSGGQSGDGTEPLYLKGSEEEGN